MSVPSSWTIRIAQDDGTDIEFRNVGFYTSDAGEIPKRTQTTFRTRRKSKNYHTSEIGIGTYTKSYELNLILVHLIVILRETETELTVFLKEQNIGVQ